MVSWILARITGHRADLFSERIWANAPSRILRSLIEGSEDQIAALFGEKAVRVSVDGRPVEGPESTLPVTAESGVVLYRPQGPAPMLPAVQL